MNPHTGRDFVQFGKTESVLNKGAKKIALLFNPPPVLSLEIMEKLHITENIDCNGNEINRTKNIFDELAVKAKRNLEKQ